MFVTDYTFDANDSLILTTVEGRAVRQRRMRKWHKSKTAVPLHECWKTRRQLTRAEAAAIRAGTLEILTD